MRNALRVHSTEGFKMELWLEDKLQLLLESKAEKDFIQGIEKAISDLGFDYYAYGVRIANPISNPKFELRNNYPDKWVQQYKDKNYVAIDPTVKHGLASNKPMTWGEVHDASDAEFWEEAKSFGLNTGWGQSTWLSHCAVGMLTVARSEQDLCRKELLSKWPYLLWLNQMVQSGFQEHLYPELIPNIEIPLTPREIEAMKWCAEGKTSGEIGMILGVSERTMNFHISNAIKKLNVVNKTAAAIRALQLGLI